MLTQKRLTLMWKMEGKKSCCSNDGKINEVKMINPIKRDLS